MTLAWHELNSIINRSPIAGVLEIAAGIRETHDIRTASHWTEEGRLAVRPSSFLYKLPSLGVYIIATSHITLNHTEERTGVLIEEACPDTFTIRAPARETRQLINILLL